LPSRRYILGRKNTIYIKNLKNISECDKGNKIDTVMDGMIWKSTSNMEVILKIQEEHCAPSSIPS
jgi:hypothetical protein